MGINKIINSIKSKFNNGVVINEDDSDIVKYLKTASGPRMTAIAAIVIGKDSFRMIEGAMGKHDQLVAALIPMEEQAQIKGELSDTNLTHLAPMLLGYVVIEMVGPINGGFSAIHYPEEMNEFQLNRLQCFNDEVEKYNNSCNEEMYKAHVIIKDPETLHGSENLQEVIDKLRDRERTR